MPKTRNQFEMNAEEDVDKGGAQLANRDVRFATKMDSLPRFE